MTSADSEIISPRRLRVGIALWVGSFIPLPVVIAAILEWAGVLTTARSTSLFLGVMWGVQFGVGFVGLLIAGGQSIRPVKACGWRQMPRFVWHILRAGQVPQDVGSQGARV
ncbi:MAG TPA: hypothetical protein VMS08_02260 [Candidatus Saccharimonadia bacterium]|nr:hypothetical protein [Candidatus Saccharimonadia bacterium]